MMEKQSVCKITPSTISTGTLRVAVCCYLGAVILFVVEHMRNMRVFVGGIVQSTQKNDERQEKGCFELKEDGGGGRWF